MMPMMMVSIKSVFPTNQLTSMFSLPSATLSFPSSTAPPQVQKDREESSTTATVVSSTCKRKQRRNGGSTSSVLFLGLPNLWRVVSIIVLIATTGSFTTVSGASIAAVNVASNAYAASKGSGVGGKLDNPHQQHHHLSQPGHVPQPHKLSFLSEHETNGNKSTVGLLNLSIGELIFGNKLQTPHPTQQQKKQEMNGKLIKKHGNMVKRNVGDTRITSNQDVTTLALATDNSSSVAIANINSSHNNVIVTIGSNSYPHRSNSSANWEQGHTSNNNAKVM